MNSPIHETILGIYKVENNFILTDFNGHSIMITQSRGTVLRIYIFISVLLLLLLLLWSPLCKARRELEHSISPKTPTPHNQPMEGRKR